MILFSRGMTRPLHQSEIACFQACNRKWQHAYVDRRVPVVPAERLTRGTRLHRVLAASDEGALVPIDDLTSPLERAVVRGYCAYWKDLPLERVSTEQPFTCTIGGVPCAGTVDAMGGDPETGRMVLVERKTTTSDITPGSLYWRRVVHCDLQVSMYLAAFPEAEVLYDVIRLPALRQKSIPIKDPERRKNREQETEPNEEFEARCLEAMLENPAKYFQRCKVVRLEHDHEAFARDVAIVDEQMATVRATRAAARNSRSCFDYGDECPYFKVCFMDGSLSDLEFTDATDR